mmetsp:Transcript_112174/g.194475  ORF Transcript_112174/g.194475 Transcript_112174/m.194475 type:complete len:291 (+) Transcript_112174:101-973(+)
MHGNVLNSAAHQEHIARMHQEMQHGLDQPNSVTMKEHGGVWNDAVFEAMHDSSSAQHIYLGVQDGALKELDLCWAPRPMPWGYIKDKAVVHRVHDDVDGMTVTVQFLSDQHRIRLPPEECKPIRDFTPMYPTVRIHPAARLPTPAEVDRLEQEKQYAAERGLPQPPYPPGFSLEDESQTHETHVSKVPRWGIPEPTLDALRNRSLAPYQITGVYGPHFYSKLYENNFYYKKDVKVARDGHVENYKYSDYDQEDPTTLIVGARYIPLNGPPEELTDNGTWRKVKRTHRLRL